MRPSDHQTCSSSNGSSLPTINNHLYPEEANFQHSHLIFSPTIPPFTVQHQCIATLKGQMSYTSSLSLAGKLLFAGSSDKEIHIWENTAALPTPDYESPINNIVVSGKGTVKALVASSDKLISAHQDHKIRVWRIDRNTDNHQHDQRPKITHSVTLPTLGDRAIKLLMPPPKNKDCTQHKNEKGVKTHHADAVSSLALSINESLLYSVSWDRTLKIWRTEDFRCVESIINAHDDAINAVAVSGDGRVYTGSSDGKIKVWGRKSGKKKHSLEGVLEKHKSGVNALAIGKDGSVLYSGGSDGSVLVWMDEGGGEGDMVVVGELRGHTKSILCLAIVSEVVVCSGSADKTMRIWGGVGKSYSCLRVLEGHSGAIKCIAVGYDAEISTYFLYSGSLDCDIKVWKIFLPI